MPRAIWSGAISFGLVTVPVKLFSAVNRKTVRFHQLSASSGMRVAQKRVDSQSGEEVPYENVVKGYELAPDRFVVIEPAELDTLQPEKTRTIDIEDFVELEQIDPIYYDHPYYLAPGAGGAKPYRLLLEAMRDTGKVAIARVVLLDDEAPEVAARGLPARRLSCPLEVAFGAVAAQAAGRLGLPGVSHLALGRGPRAFPFLGRRSRAFRLLRRRPRGSRFAGRLP